MDEADRALLKEEYFVLQKIYEDFDGKSLTIKGWIASGSIAAFIFSRQQGKFDATVGMLIILICVSIWAVEVVWKLYQRGFADRIRIIEGYFRNDELLDPVFPLQIYHKWSKSYSQDRPVYQYEIDKGLRPKRLVTRALKMAMRPSVLLPYGPIILFTAWMMIR